MDNKSIGWNDSLPRRTSLDDDNYDITPRYIDRSTNKQKQIIRLDPTYYDSALLRDNSTNIGNSHLLLFCKISRGFHENPVGVDNLYGDKLYQFYNSNDTTPKPQGVLECFCSTCIPLNTFPLRGGGNDHSNNTNNNVSATSNNIINTNQYYHQLANYQSQCNIINASVYGGYGRASNNQVLPNYNTSNNNKRNYQQMANDDHLTPPGRFNNVMATRGAAIVPCRARGMPVDHNFKTAYFVIPDGIEHGDELMCSYPACRQAGVKFRYCLQCRVPVAKRNFRTCHRHGVPLTDTQYYQQLNIKLQDRSRELAILQQNNAAQAASGGLVAAKKQSVIPLPREKPSSVQDPPSQLHNDALQSATTLAVHPILAQQEDVLFGRGNQINKHPGNLRYRDEINKYRPSYVSAQKIEKPNVAYQVVKAIKEGDNPGRFLRKGEDNKWYEVSDKEAASKSSQALREKSKKVASKKCGKCSVEKFYRSYTKEQWWVAEDNERECKVCEKYAALMEEGRACQPLEEKHLIYCQFINGDGHYGENASENCSDVDDGWRLSPKCSNAENFMQMNRHQPFCCDEGSVVEDDDSTGNDSLQFLAGGDDEYQLVGGEYEPGVPPPPPPAVEQPPANPHQLVGGYNEYDPEAGVPPPPPPAVDQPPANPPQIQHPPFVELSPGRDGAVDNDTILNGIIFVFTGGFPEVPFGPEPQGVQGDQDYRPRDYRIITRTITRFGGQVSESIPPCDYYLLRGYSMPIRSVVRSALRREQKIVRLCQLQRLLMGTRSLENWDRQRSESFNLRGAIGPNYTPPPGTVRRHENGRRLCRHGDCCPKLATSPHNEWNGYCASHFYESLVAKKTEADHKKKWKTFCATILL